MISNAEFINLIEYGNYEDFALKQDPFANLINNKICSLIKCIKKNFSTIRSQFSVTNPDACSLDHIPFARREIGNAHFEMTPGFPPRHGDLLDPHLDYNRPNGLEHTYIPGLANRQISAPAVSYSEHSND